MNSRLKIFLLLGVAALACTATISGAATADSAGTTVNLPTDIATANTPVVAVYKVNTFSEGPAWDGKGRLTFSSTNLGKIYSYVPATKAQTEYITLQAVNGQEWANDGRLYACAKGGIFSFDAQGGDKQTVLTASPDPNDLTIDSKGNMFFSTFNPSFYYRPAGGAAKTVNPKAYVSSNGIEYLEESGILYVNDYGGNRVYKYTVAADGSLSNETNFATVTSPDGLTIDEKGNLYIASGGSGKSIVVFNPSGTKLGQIDITTSLGNKTSNCVFGGPDLKTLFITGDGGLFAVQLNVAGRVRPSSSTAIRNRYGLSSPRNGKEISGLRNLSGTVIFELPGDASRSHLRRGLMTGRLLPSL